MTLGDNFKNLSTYSQKKVGGADTSYLRKDCFIGRFVLIG